MGAEYLTIERTHRCSGREYHPAHGAALSHIGFITSSPAIDRGEIEGLWHHLDHAVDCHPEAFQESLQHLLPDLSSRSEIEVDLLSQLVLACGDVSLVNFVRLSGDAIASAREALKNGSQIVGDITAVTATLVGVASPPGESDSISSFSY
jgi:precorrin-8X/cobalt-precorrin-8 methylmutase